jgi:streptogramin lyase
MTRRILLAAACAALVVGATSASTSAPLALDQPLGIDVAPNGSLLVVEFGSRRLVRVTPSTGRVAPVETFTKPWGVARAPSGSIFVSDGGKLRLVDPGHAPVTVATAGPTFEIGPVAVTHNEDVVYATAYALYRLRDPLALD